MTRCPLVNICAFLGPMLGVEQTLSSFILTAVLYGGVLCSLLADTQNHTASQRESEIHSLPFRVLSALLYLLFY